MQQLGTGQAYANQGLGLLSPGDDDQYLALSNSGLSKSQKWAALAGTAIQDGHFEVKETRRKALGVRIPNEQLKSKMAGIISQRHSKKFLQQRQRQ
eukprot:CAMPEP_0194581710 /NCGR_PEP_ID=MMETSP0292-20121207/15097_1 /TAXON_ID=39354 /ORGANISM="Heterosigma akashiwo, Strain CCMP2393" /LENGTH=95 /DNA_ID=CAMNT_0039435575 /DNA_START=236 /DNA_END=523 /DNA_ORIENTATION=-